MGRHFFFAVILFVYRVQLQRETAERIEREQQERAERERSERREAEWVSISTGACALKFGHQVSKRVESV